MLWYVFLCIFLGYIFADDNNVKICEVEDLVEYTIIQRLPITNSLFEGCNALLSISGTNNSISDILLCGKNGKFRSSIKHVGVDIGDIKYIILDKGESYVYECLEIEIYKENRFWKFNCEQSENQKIKLYPEGNKPYVIELRTGSQIGAGSEGKISVKLIGENGETGFIYLTDNVKRGSVGIYHIRASDVGDVRSIVLLNDSSVSPWYCVSLTLIFNDKKVIFGVNLWLGGSYDNKVLVSLSDNSFVHEVTCFTRLLDIFPGIPGDKLHSFVVKCPLNCPKDKIEGHVLHPGSASICSSAVSDGVISYGGGEIVVTVGSQLPRYNGGNDGKTIDYEPFNPTSTFYLYKISSIDDIESKIRLVDGRGELASIGRLEIYDDNTGHWGTVCNSGKSAKFTSKAAHLICNHLGFETGERVYSGCKDVYGDYMCGSKGYPVSIAGFGCMGDEKSINQCIFEKPSLECLNHDNDVVIHCRRQISSFGDLRLINGKNQADLGRLEINIGGYRPICSDNWSVNEALVACNQLGYGSLNGDGCINCHCEDVDGNNYCSKSNDDNMIKITCKGYEDRLNECKIESVDEHECNGEVVLSCLDKQLSKINVERLEFNTKPHKPILKLSCYDTAKDLEFENDGIRIVNCPSGCKHAKSPVEGTFVYSLQSSICKSAIHSGVLDDDGDLVVRLVSGIKRVYSTNRNDILSLEGVDIDKGFTLSRCFFKLKEDKKIENDHSVESKTDLLRPIYTITPKEAFTGFNFLDVTNYEFWKKISSGNKFSISMHFKPGVTKGRNTLFSLGDCGGLVLSLEDGQVIVEQICHNASVIRARVENDLDIDGVIHFLLTYHGPSKSIAIYTNGVNIIHKRDWSGISLKGPKYIGRPGAMEGDYLSGRVFSVDFFDVVLSLQDSQNLIKNYNSTRRGHDDGKIHCLKSKFESSNLDFKSIVLGCGDDLSAVNGFVGQSFQVYCGEDCSDLKWPIHGSGIYSPDSSICKAAMHAGAGSHVLLKLLDGLASYKSTRGHNGIISCSETSPQLLSFSVSPMVTSEYLNCNDDAMWILKSQIGSEHIVMCPNDCINSKGNVYGTDVYSPNSSVCKAALHSKNIKGNIRIELEVVEGLAEYVGSERNGIRSLSQRGYLRSFKIVNVDECKV